MSTESLRQAVRAQLQTALAKRQATSTSGSAASGTRALVVPLRLRHVNDAQTLTQLFKRLAANPSLLQMVDAGLLRFDLQVDAAVAQALGNADATPQAVACCGRCAGGQSCEGGSAMQSDPGASASAARAPVPLLKGVVSERQVNVLASTVQSIRLDPRAVLTPLGREALRKRGIAIEKGGASS